jgi:hypothetical protein
MGASGWHHFVPFDTDPARGLARLREEIFRRGAYFSPKKKKAASIEQLLALCGESGTHSVLDVNRLVSAPHPQSSVEWMRELAQAGREASAAELSAHLATQVACIGAVAPVPRERLRELCGSERPDHAALERAVFLLFSLCPRGAGLWTTGYDADGAPSELLFLGKTGD